MQQHRNIYAMRTEHSCNERWTNGNRNAKDRELASYESGTFFEAMQQDRNFLNPKCNKSGTFKQARNKIGTFQVVYG